MSDVDHKAVTFVNDYAPSLSPRSPRRPVTSQDFSIPSRGIAGDSTEDRTMNSHPLEVYLHYSRRERSREEVDYRPVPDAPWTVLFKNVTGEGVAVTPKSPGQRRQHGGQVREWMNSWRGNDVPPQVRRLSSGTSTADHSQSHDVDDKVIPGFTELAERSEGGFVLSVHEKETAYRLTRVASWQVVFYLIVTSQLGWITAAETFNVLGYGPGVLVYSFFWLLAFACGQILWKLFMRLDSERYPIKSYSDIAERTYGPFMGFVVNIVQCLQLGLQVGTFLIIDGHGLSQIIDFKFCFLALNVFFALLGMVLSQTRSLRNIAVITYFNFFLNIIIMVITMFGVTLYDPVPENSGHKDLSEPIRTSAWIPKESGSWVEQVGGVQLAVFAYAGATIFTEFMAEMRRPRDFWKAAFSAQLFVYVCYLFFGLFAYSIQGQYSAVLPTINMANRVFQGVTNIIGLFLAMAISVLYANIGCKMVYRLILRRFWSKPSLTSRASRPWWALTTVFYWTVAWLVGSAIPNISDLSNVISSVLVMPMTYVIPPALLVGHWVQSDAMTADYPWRPGMDPYANRTDNWKNLSRWRRGFKPYWYAKLGLMLIVIGAISLMVLGLWSAIIQVQASFAKGVTLAYSCTAPRK